MAIPKFSRPYNRWQIIRRDPEYLSFCQKHSFQNGVLDEWEALEPEAERIMDLFGLEMIYHPSTNLSEDAFINLPVFKDVLAVKCEYREEAPLEFTPIWDEHYIKLTIDIGSFRNTEEILSEVREQIKSARTVAEIEETRQSGIRTTLEVWDLHHIQGYSSTEIIKTLWPEEYKEEFLRDSPEMEKKFVDLQKKYKRLGLKDYRELAHHEVYESDKAEGKTRLYQRVSDNLNKMQRKFQEVRNK